MNDASSPLARYTSDRATGGPPLLSGLIAASFTPMTASGDVDLAAIPDVTKFVLGQGVSGLFICGSTGESPSLTTSERLLVAEAYVGSIRDLQLPKRAPAVVQVGHNSLRESSRIAAHAESIGADAIGVVPPSYFPPSSLDGLMDSLKEIAAAAPGTPLFYYHIPRLSGVSTRMIDLLERATDELPSLVGIKFSSFEMDDLIRCVHFEGGRYNILFGSDEMLLAGLAMGAQGAVGSTYNFMGPRFRKVIDAFEGGRMEEAQRHQFEATRMVHTIVAAGGGGAIKAAMSILGSDCGPPRLPLETVVPARLEELRRELESMPISEKNALERA